MAKLDLGALLARVASETGLADPGAVANLKPGAVFEVSDRLVIFPGDQPRTWHELRRVVVVQGHSFLGPVNPDTVMVVPCSASQTKVRRGDFEVPDGEPGFTKTSVVAYTTLVMPVLKTALTPEGHRGQLTDETFGRLLGMIAKNLGIGFSATMPPR